MDQLEGFFLGIHPEFRNPSTAVITCYLSPVLWINWKDSFWDSFRVEAVIISSLSAVLFVWFWSFILVFFKDQLEGFFWGILSEFRDPPVAVIICSLSSVLFVLRTRFEAFWSIDQICRRFLTTGHFQLPLERFLTLRGRGGAPSGNLMNTTR